MAAYDLDGYSEVIVLCPSRENAAGALGMVESFYDTVARIATEVVIVIDEDEPQAEQYKAIPATVAARPVGLGVRRADLPRIMVVPGGSLTKATNEAVARMWDADSIIGHVGDDHRFRTPGWDTIIREALLDKPGVVYGYDGFRSAWASAWWTNMKIVRTLGWLAVPGSKHLTIDDVFMDIGAGLGEHPSDRLQFLPKVLIEHLHPAGGKVEWREIVRSHYAPKNRKPDEENLRAYRRDHFANDITRLRDALGLPHFPVEDLSPGQTFRRNLRGLWRLPAAGAHYERVFPSDEELAIFWGRVPNNSAEWLRARRAWAKAQ